MRTTLLLTMLVATAVYADVQETNKTERRFTMAAGPRRLVVDNVFGSITVRAGSGNEVQFVVNEHWRADDNSAMSQARREVRLDFTQESDMVKAYVDGPFRCRNRDCGDNHRDYDVRFDFDVVVPADARLELKTVNSGRVQVEGTGGDFEIRNVNGAIEMKNVAGSGTARTVNGGVKASFRQSPQGACEFKTVNGGVEVTVPANYSAEVSAKNLNGSILTDFEATALPIRMEDAPQRDGPRFVYRSRGGARIRIGNGGPEHKLETLNGDIVIRKAGVQ
jgi:hypothetical protein